MLYIYAFVEQKPTARSLGRGIHARALSAIAIANESAWAIVEKGDAMPPEAETIVAHDRVVQRIAESSRAVLPLRFGSTAADRATLDAMIRPVAGHLQDAFDRVRDAVQFTMRVSGPPAPKKKRPRAKTGTRYLEDLLAKHRAPEIDVVTKATKSLVRASRIDRKDAKDLLAVVYHLVDRADVERYERAVTRAMGKLDDAISLRRTGPWPPYAFAELS